MGGVDTLAEGSKHALACDCTIPAVPTLRLFASAREAAGTGRDDVPGETVGELIAVASARYGAAFVEVLGSCKIWVNGDAATPDTPLSASDEVAILPPVSGGAFEIGHPEGRRVAADQIAEEPS